MKEIGRFITLSKVLLTTVVIYLAIVLLFVLFPRPILDSTDPLDLQPFLMAHTGTFYEILYADSSTIQVSNFFLFTPAAVFIKLVFPKTKSLYIFFGFLLLSLAIETLQLLIPGRVSDWRELLANGVSAAIGLILAMLIDALRRKI
jgi:glycopeptide antibiotics resistance protein